MKNPENSQKYLDFGNLQSTYFEHIQLFQYAKS